MFYISKIINWKIILASSIFFNILSIFLLFNIKIDNLIIMDILRLYNGKEYQLKKIDNVSFNLAEAMTNYKDFHDCSRLVNIDANDIDFSNIITDEQTRRDLTKQIKTSLSGDKLISYKYYNKNGIGYINIKIRWKGIGNNRNIIYCIYEGFSGIDTQSININLPVGETVNKELINEIKNNIISGIKINKDEIPKLLDHFQNNYIECSKDIDLQVLIFHMTENILMLDNKTKTDL
jgi:hypothetical protein